MDSIYNSIEQLDRTPIWTIKEDPKTVQDLIDTINSQFSRISNSDKSPIETRIKGCAALLKAKKIFLRRRNKRALKPSIAESTKVKLALSHIDKTSNTQSQWATCLKNILNNPSSFQNNYLKLTSEPLKLK